jgi:hypothetical protein
MNRAQAAVLTESFSAWYPASNGPLTTSTPTSFDTTPWNGTTQSVSLPLFNSTQGTLTGVSIELYEQIQTYGSLMNTDTGAGQTSTIQGAHNSGYGESMDVAVFPKGTPTPLGGTTGNLATVGATIEHLSNGTKVLPGQTLTFGTVTSPLVLSNSTTTSVGNIASFLGTSSAVFPLYANALTTGGFSGGNLSITQHTVVRVEVTANYTYSTPQPPSVPEPTSMVLLGSGLIGLGAARKRGWHIHNALAWLRRHSG